MSIPSDDEFRRILAREVPLLMERLVEVLREPCEDPRLHGFVDGAVKLAAVAHLRLILCDAVSEAGGPLGDELVATIEALVEEKHSPSITSTQVGIG